MIGHFSKFGKTLKVRGKSAADGDDPTSTRVSTSASILDYQVL